MKRCIGWLMGMMAAGALSAATTNNITFHVQLVRGSDEPAPPAPESKPIGPKVGAQFQQVFAWKYFWQVHYESVQIPAGKKARFRLSPQREVIIDLARPGKRTVTALSEGKAVARARDGLEAPMTLIGGDRAPRSAWFIVVRRDKPSTE